MSDRSAELRRLVADGSVHFAGVGGAGMCALAELFVRSGGTVSGCDRKDSVALRDLAALGADIHVGHDAAHVDSASALIVTAAMPTDHPELTRARERGIPVFKRAEALGAWVAGGTVVAIAGTHGKTTTTAMATEILAQAGMNPTGIVGGRVQGWGGNLRYGADELFVVEADEYDRSFHTLTPDVAVVTNLEADHLDIYGDLAGVVDGFRTFLRGTRLGGRVVVCADDSGAASLLAAVGDQGYTYGMSAGSMLRAVDVRVAPDATRCRIVEGGVDVGEARLALGGHHNLRNALGAAAAARTLGADWKPILEALETFAGVGRRFEHLGAAAGVTVIDDYAHHPTEIEATLAAVRAMYPSARIVAAFQPHLFSRTRDFADDFGVALAGADVLWVTDVFPAREEPISGVTGETIVAAARAAAAPDVRYCAELFDLLEALTDTVAPGDVLLTMGAGSIESVGRGVLDRLRERIHA